MRLAKIIGTVTATAKDAALTGAPLLVADMIDAKGKVIAAGHVAIDGCGAGVGDTVLIAQGSAARVAQGRATLPTDAAVVAIVDDISLS